MPLFPVLGKRSQLNKKLPEHINGKPPLCVGSHSLSFESVREIRFDFGHTVYAEDDPKCAVCLMEGGFRHLEYMTPEVQAFMEEQEKNVETTLKPHIFMKNSQISTVFGLFRKGPV